MEKTVEHRSLNRSQKEFSLSFYPKAHADSLRLTYFPPTLSRFSFDFPSLLFERVVAKFVVITLDRCNAFPSAEFAVLIKPYPASLLNDSNKTCQQRTILRLCFRSLGAVLSSLPKAFCEQQKKHFKQKHAQTSGGLNGLLNREWTLKSVSTVCVAKELKS